MDTSVIYLTVKELSEEAGVSQLQLRKHVTEGLLDTVMGQPLGASGRKHASGAERKCHKLLFHPDEAKVYVELMKDFVPEDRRKNPRARKEYDITRKNEGYPAELAAKYCAVSDTTIRSAVRAGHIKVISENPLRISDEEVEKYRAALADRIGLQEAAILLNLTTSAVRSLVSSGGLKGVFEYMGNVYLSRKGVQESIKKYDKAHQCRPRGAHPSMRRLK